MAIQREAIPHVRQPDSGFRWLSASSQRVMARPESEWRRAGADGALYGTLNGGDSDGGSVFQLQLPSQAPWPPSDFCY